MSTKSFALAALTVASVITWAPSSAMAAVVPITNPGLETEIGARIRWGGSGSKGFIVDQGAVNNQGNHLTFNSFRFSVGQPYDFFVDYTASSGMLTLAVDFNRDGLFGTTEQTSQSTFVANPGLTNYAGYGFNYLQISGSSRTNVLSRIDNLTINGQSFSPLVTTGTFLDTFYDENTKGPTEWNITGALTFLNPSTNQETPAWNFAFRFAELMPAPSQVPTPATLLLTAVGLLGLGFSRRRQS